MSAPQVQERDQRTEEVAKVDRAEASGGRQVHQVRRCYSTDDDELDERRKNKRVE